MYIDQLYTYNGILIDNVVNTQVININGVNMLYIVSGEDNKICNLPRSCKCPVQHIFQITPEYSTTLIMNKETQRVYSYNDKQISIYITTNSISSSEFCR